MIIKVNVKPNSRENKIEKIGEEYKVFLKAPARDGKANVALIKLLAKEFEVGWKYIKIKNPTSKRKIVEVLK